MTFPIRVSDIMSSPVRTADVDTTAAEAAAQCTAEEIGSIVVVKEGETAGIVTESDLVALLGMASDPKMLPLREFMSEPVHTVDSDASLHDAVDIMREHGVSRLVVVDAGHRVGLVSTDDIVRHVPQLFHRQQFPSPPPEDRTYQVRQETAYEKADWAFESAFREKSSVSIGDKVSFSKTLSQQDIRTFAAASGDTNRLHLDEEYAGKTRFGRRIVHGTLVSGLVSAALARLPGVTIYLSQDLTFLAPVDIGDRVTAVCEVVGSLGRNKYELTTDVLGPDGERIIEGEATVLIDDPIALDRIEAEQTASH
jgi:acyl dehydratase/CBS domain-containing protein